MKTKIFTIDPSATYGPDDAPHYLRWSFHLCPDAEDLKCGYHDGKRPPLRWDRVHVNTPWFHLMAALWPSGRFMKRLKDGDGKWAGYQREWIVLRPHRRLR